MKKNIVTKTFCILMILSILVTGNVLAVEESVQTSAYGTGTIEVSYTMLDGNGDVKTVEKSINADINITYGEAYALISANAPAAEYKALDRQGWRWNLDFDTDMSEEKVFQYDNEFIYWDVFEKYKGYSLVELTYDSYTEDGYDLWISEVRLYQDTMTYKQVADDAAQTDIRPEFEGLDFTEWKITEEYEEYLSDAIGEGTFLVSVLMQPVTKNALVRFWVDMNIEMEGASFYLEREIVDAYVVEKGTKIFAPETIGVYQNLSWDIEEIVVEENLVEFIGLVNSKLDFSDVKIADWFCDSVAYVNYHGLMTGLSQTSFGPTESLARAQFAVILHRMNESPKMLYTERFPDVGQGLWYTDAILWAADTGVVTGYSSTGKFGPGDKINREQMAVMMYRYAKYKNYDVNQKADFSEFMDALSVSSFAVDAMEWAVGNGIITGKDNGTRLDPQGNASRAECAAIIMRFMKNYEQ